MMFKVLCVLLIAFPVVAQINDIIPAYRLTEWGISDYVGVRGGPLTNRSVYTNYNPVSGTEISSDFQGVLNNCPSNETVKIGPGDFFVDAGINIPNGITIKGSGAIGVNRTLFNFRSGGMTRANGNNSHLKYQGHRFSLPVLAGTTNVTVGDGGDFIVGDLALLSRANSTSQTESNLVMATAGQSNTNNNNGWIYHTTRRILNISGNVVTFNPPLEKDWTNDSCIWPMPLVSEFIGLEEFAVIGSNVVHAIRFEGSRDCWVLNVKVTEAKNYSLSFNESINCYVSNNQLLDGKGTGSNGSHLLMDTCTGFLVENNVIVNAFPGIEMNSGCNRNVIAYNYLFNTNGLAEIYSNHGPHNTYNLFEGNIYNHHLSDGYAGSESEGTMFRNWIMAHEPATTQLSYTVGLKRFTRNYNVVGNIFGRGAPYTTTFDGYSWGGVGSGVGTEPPAPPWADFPTGGPDPATVYLERDSGVSNTLVLKVNYNFHDDGIPAGEASSATLPNSLYLTEKPWYFPNNYTYPPINSANVNTSFNPSNTFIIPAQYAYFNGGEWPTNSLDTPVTNAPPRFRGFRFR